MRAIDADHLKKHLRDVQSKCAPGGVLIYAIDHIIKIIDEEPCIDEPNTYYRQRSTDIFRKRNIGMTFEEISKDYGISRDRVRAVYLRECRRRGIEL